MHAASKLHRNTTPPSQVHMHASMHFCHVDADGITPTPCRASPAASVVAKGPNAISAQHTARLCSRFTTLLVCAAWATHLNTPPEQCPAPHSGVRVSLLTQWTGACPASRSCPCDGHTAPAVTPPPGGNSSSSSTTQYSPCCGHM